MADLIKVARCPFCSSSDMSIMEDEQCVVDSSTRKVVSANPPIINYRVCCDECGGMSGEYRSEELAIAAWRGEAPR